MKKKVTITSIIFIFILIGVLVSINFKKEESSYKENDSLETPSQIVGENTLSMMLETAYQSGNYDKTTRSDWPTDGYEFNPTLSKCENGGELSWDDEKKLVSMTGNMSDKCYVYFDKLPLPLSEWVKEQYNNTQGNNGIYYHNGTIASDDGTVLDANDNSYRYSGASDSVNNYVCFGSDETTCPEDNLYRIIGVFGDQVKLIKATAATSSLLGTDGAYFFDTYYKWSSLSSCPSSTTGYVNDNSSGTMFMSNKIAVIFEPVAGGCNEWESSDLNTTNLNTNFITNIGTTWAEMIDKTTWKVGGNEFANIANVTPSVAYQNEVGSSSSSTTVDAKIGLMYASDYGFAADPAAWTTTLYNYGGSVDGSTIKSLDWLALGSTKWLVSRISDNLMYSFVIYGGRVDNRGTGENGEVRPVFYLNSSVTYVSGNGSSTLPVRVN